MLVHVFGKPSGLSRRRATVADQSYAQVSVRTVANPDAGAQIKFRFGWLAGLHGGALRPLRNSPLKAPSSSAETLLKSRIWLIMFSASSSNRGGVRLRRWSPSVDHLLHDTTSSYSAPAQRAIKHALGTSLTFLTPHVNKKSLLS